jgi:hypothetical protein
MPRCKAQEADMTTRKSFLAATLAAVFALGIGATVHGWSGQNNTIKFGGAVALPGVLLPAGEYKFTMIEGNPDVVRVTRASDNKAYYLGFTNKVERPRSLGNRVIVLGEADAGTPPPIATWFPSDGGTGHAFIY